MLRRFFSSFMMPFLWREKHKILKDELKKPKQDALIGEQFRKWEIWWSKFQDWKLLSKKGL